MEDLIQRVNRQFVARNGSSPSLYSQAPGRINIIGEHVDYTFGYSLPAAINRWTVCAWKARDDKALRIVSLDMDEVWEASWTTLESSIDKNWKKYVGGAIRLFQRAQLDASASGFDLVISGNVPLGKGVSSSASIELAILNGLNALYKKQMSPQDLALMAQQVEHQFLKLKSGLLDQFASQFSKKDHALLIDFEVLKTESVKLSSGFNDFSWVIIDSMVERQLAGSKYSERVEECAQIQAHLEKKGVKNIRQVTSEAFEPLLGDLPETILRRARHIVTENERTLKALELLKTDQIEAMGELLYESHASLALDYEVSHTNLDFLVEASQSVVGVAGGRMMGGGFGGCCIFLVQNSQLENACNIMSREYEKFCGTQTEPLVFTFVDGASAFVLNN